MTKKDIYASYGIEYKAGKIFAPVFGWVNPLLIDGNEKIGKGCYHFSMLPTNQLFVFWHNEKEYSAMGTCACYCKGCYATKGNYNYDSTKESLGIKTLLAREYLDFVERAIMAQIVADNIRLLRVHAAGDFFNAAYVEMWRHVALAFPGVIMWTYTKVSFAENAFNDVPNFNIVKSVIPGKGFNFGHCDYILSLYEYLKQAGKSVYICKCGIDKNQHCVNCGACRKCDYVLFIEHSTEYKAEKDPLFAVLKALIESQESMLTD